MDKIENLSDQPAIKKLQEMIKDIRVCMFFTEVHTKEQGRPMSVADIDEDGIIRFLSDKNSEKIASIKNEDEVHLVFSHPGKEMYLDLYGDASVSEDKSEIDACWTPLAKAWFPEGKDDPNICVIRIYPVKGNYWDTQHGKMIEFLKIIAAAVTGNKEGDGVSGDILLTK
ncbi:MAG: pyridoxamine 5'-phosphate oxidase family protein [Bacteroidetes bacterium]|nr:pyridoxamine 5'-phosphate oxidase family protein [Bacteroidota bacterium]